MRRNNTSTPSARKATRKAPKSAEAKAARAARKKALGEMYVDQLRDVAATLDITGRSSLGKAELVAAILKAEGGTSGGRKKYTLTEARAKVGGARARKLQGRGPFRMILLNASGAPVGDMGPYASARGAQVDAKTLLRRMVGGDAVLNHAAAMEEMATGGAALNRALKGQAVDGWVATEGRGADAGDEGDGEDREVFGSAWVVKMGGDAAVAAATFPEALRHNGRRRANPRVAFQTANGPVSFNARRNSAPAAAPRARGNAGKVQLTPHQNREVDRLYEMGRPAISRIATVQPNAFTLWQHVLIYVVGNGMDGQRFLSAVQHFDMPSLLPGDQTGFRTVITDAGVKVTPAAFVPALSTLRRAMGVV